MLDILWVDLADWSKQTTQIMVFLPFISTKEFCPTTFLSILSKADN